MSFACMSEQSEIGGIVEFVPEALSVESCGGLLVDAGECSKGCTGSNKCHDEEDSHGPCIREDCTRCR